MINIDLKCLKIYKMENETTKEGELNKFFLYLEIHERNICFAETDKQVQKYTNILSYINLQYYKNIKH